MKIKKSTIILASVLLCGMTVIPVNAEGLDAARDAYQQVIRQYNESVFDGFTGDDLGYALYYIDSDEIPELFVCYPNGYMEVYTMDQGQSKCMMYVYGPYQNGDDQFLGYRFFYQEGNNFMTLYNYGMNSDRQWEIIQNCSLNTNPDAEDTLNTNYIAHKEEDSWFIGETQYSEDQLDILFFPQEMKEIGQDWKDPYTMSELLQNGVWTEAAPNEKEGDLQSSEAKEIACELADLVIKDLQQVGNTENYDRLYAVFYSHNATIDYKVIEVNGNQVTLQIDIDAPDYKSKREDFWTTLFYDCYANEITNITEDDKSRVFVDSYLFSSSQPENLHYTRTITIPVVNSDLVGSTAYIQLYKAMDILPDIYAEVAATPDDENFARLRELGCQRYLKSHQGQEEMMNENLVEIVNDMSKYWEQGYGLVDSELLVLKDSVVDDLKLSVGSDPLISAFLDHYSDRVDTYVGQNSIDGGLGNRFWQEISNGLNENW